MYTNRRLLNLTENKPDEALEKFEEHAENEIVSTLRNVGIQTTVKQDKFSLPYTHEMVFRIPLESCLSAVYEYQRPLRQFVKELLSTNTEKIRFYLWVDFFEGPPPKNQIHHTNAGLEYHFRYFIHGQASSAENKHKCIEGVITPLTSA